MLKQWTVENFKSFKGRHSVNLAAVNVLAGANSSGKSTLIQSILLLKQTLQYGAEDRTITLNGPLLRLGYFADICNNKAETEEVRICFDVEIKQSEDSTSGKPHWARSAGYAFQMEQSNRWTGISLDLTYGTPEAASLSDMYVAARTMAPTLFKSDLCIAGDIEGEKNESEWQLSLDSTGRWPYHLLVDSRTQREIIAEYPEGKIEGALSSYFLPELAIVRYNKTSMDVSALTDSMFRDRGTFLGSLMSLDVSLSPEIVAMINEWLVQHDEEPLVSEVGDVRAADVQKRFVKFTRANYFGGLLRPASHEPTLISDLDVLKTNVESTMLSERKVEYKVTGQHSKGLNYAVTYVGDFFRYGIRYLGPLRDSPRPVYQPEALESTTDVGYRGEHTAAVFEINKKTHLRFHLPPTPETEANYITMAEASFKTLESATAIWLEYLGVAASVETLDAGVFGNRLRVSIEDGSPLQDLTNVGVGVSQVLPIVVMALLAPPGSLLIFEQPELHLHPKVQARLADFFLALAVDGKQTVLETHSEYLVDRLRLRIATSSDDNVRPLVNILFSEKREGCSHLSPVEISEFGAILNWPADFFEQSQKDVSRIVQAASQKRKLKSRQP
jgi:predicted ATPase